MVKVKEVDDVESTKGKKDKHISKRPIPPTLFTFGQKKWQIGGGLLSSRNFPLIMVITIKRDHKVVLAAPNPCKKKRSCPSTDFSRRPGMQIFVKVKV